MMRCDEHNRVVNREATGYIPWLHDSILVKDRSGLPRTVGRSVRL
jgi:hypothetical protein